MSSVGYHEPVEELSDESRELHRAIVSLMEELEAVDWYQQRIDATEDEELAAILAHNRDEEKEHAAMVLEWLRRRDPGFDEHLRDYLFIDQSVLEREEEIEAGESGEGDGSLGIGDLRGEGGR